MLRAAVFVAVLLGGPLLAQPGPAPRWPQFRGPQGRAVTDEAKPLPVQFGPGQNVLWKTPLPAGHSSPCVWGERIFLTSFDGKAQKLETLCLDRHNGAVRWRRTAPAARVERVNNVNSPAAATPATNGQRVYVSFGSYGLLCYDFEGKELWRRPLPTPRTRFGTATSPIVAGDLVLLNGQGKDLHLLAVRAATGETVWTTAGSPFPSEYPVPLLCQHEGRTEVIVPGAGGLLAYDLKDGSRLWWVPGLSPEATASPVQGDGLLFVASHLPGGDPDLRMKLPDLDDLLAKYDRNKDGKLNRQELPKDVMIFSRGGKDGVGDIRLDHMFWLFDRNGDGYIDRTEWQALLTTPFNNALLAIRPGGAKDVSQSHVAWQFRRGVPEVPSPLYYRGRLYLVRHGGLLTCLEAKTGKEVFPRSRLGPEGVYYASPVAGDGKVYVASDSGVVVVLRAGDRFEVLAANDLGEPIRATPALVDGVIYLRTAGHLYAFREPAP
ncbi:MAG: PQQ-binding-like beta-propeller repeat protein [Gemmataceae bacterium]|nr:PQQ-binding-like beta-propeller repeat protein [Gemmataceae bacterium]